MGELNNFYAAMRLAVASDNSYFWLAHLIYLFGEPIWTERVERAAVDKHARLYLNADYFSKLTPSHAVGVLVHEASHVLLDHAARSEELPVPPELHRLANLAQDAVINEAGKLYERLPDGCVTAASLGVKPGLPWEVYYRELLEKATVVRVTCQCGSGAHGVSMPWELPADDANRPARAREVIQAVVHQVAEEALAQKARGTVPGEWLRWAEKIVCPAVNWDAMLFRGVNDFAASQSGADLTDWSRMSRRRQHQQVLFPGKRAVARRVAVVVDTSGSMSEQELGHALGLVDSALATRRVEVTVYAVDAQAAPAQKVRTAREVKLLGGGGTDMRVGLRAAEEARIPYARVVVVTDGETPWPDKSPSLPVLVVILGQAEFPSWSGQEPHKQLRWIPKS